MARTTPGGERWAEWLNAQLESRGWRQVDLLNALGDDGPKRQTVNNWVKGVYSAEGDMALTVGDVFGEPVEALRAAGYPKFAARLESQARQGATPAATAPTRQLVQLEQYEEGLREIRARGLPPAREKAAIDDFTRRANRTVAFVFEEFRDDAAEVRNAASKTA